MSWRLAKSLTKLRDQINAAAPGRSKASDGTVGDAKHASRKSDHNPDKAGVVKALDITHDPKHGVDGSALAEALRGSRDARISYIIWNRQIWSPTVSPAWRPYKGANPHTKHVHISVTGDGDDRPWAIGELAPDRVAADIPDRPLLMRDAQNDPAAYAQAKAALINALGAEKNFGPLMEGLVKAFQAANRLKADGKIGAYTWDALIK